MRETRFRTGVDECLECRCVMPYREGALCRRCDRFWWYYGGGKKVKQRVVNKYYGHKIKYILEAER